MPRFVPDIDTSQTDGYATLLGDNFDTVQESYNMVISDALAERLEYHKGMAQERDTAIEFTFGGELFQIWIGGSQGKKWVIEHDDFQIHFGTPKQSWPITVRYRAAGLWEYGFDALKNRVVQCLLKECHPHGPEDEWEQTSTWQRISMVHYAFDFFSPDFSAEMYGGKVRGKVLAPSGVKLGVIGTSLRDETINIGYSRPGLIIQVYDKGQEITDMSGKTWMYAVWEREGYYPASDKAHDVWRVEIRMGKEYLQNRGILTFDQVQDQLSELLAEALFSRRMVEPSATDGHRERWPLHPLWAAAYAASGRAGQYLPIGRQITLRRNAMKDCLEKQLMGTLRARATIDGDYDQRTAQQIGETTIDDITKDKKHRKKVSELQERYRFIEDAR